MKRLEQRKSHDVNVDYNSLRLARIVEACYKYCKPLKSLVLLAWTFFLFIYLDDGSTAVLEQINFSHMDGSCEYSNILSLYWVVYFHQDRS